MPSVGFRSRLLSAPVALIALAATVAVAGCGGGSSSSGTTTASNALASGGGGRRAAIAACLKKQGLNLPQRPRGEGRGGPGLFGGGGRRRRFQNPQFRAALRKCGINPPAGRRFNGSMYRQTITKFAACVRQNGYNLPAPNFSGRGPVFDPSKVNRNDPKFMAAARKCQGLLRFRRPDAPAPGGAAGSA